MTTAKAVNYRRIKMCNKQKRDYKAKTKQKNDRAMRQRRIAKFNQQQKKGY